MTMQIAGQKIAGFSAVKVRNALRRMGGSDYFDADRIFAEYLHIVDGRKITKAVVELGYIERTTPKFAWGDKRTKWYVFTKSGESFTRASGIARMPRSKAELTLTRFLDRISETNAGPYAFLITKAVVFGSFIRDEQTLGDLDIAIELTSRYTDEDERDKAEEKRRRIFERRGRHFSNIVDRICWPEREVFKHLKGGERYLSLHSTRDLFDMARKSKAPVPHRVIFGGPLVFPAEVS